MFDLERIGEPYTSLQDGYNGVSGLDLVFGHADASAAATVRYPTRCFCCSARFDGPARASRRIAT